jgi:putative transposase
MFVLAPEERHFKWPAIINLVITIFMPNTYTQIYIHIVFAVRGRQHFIHNSFREELEKYISGIITQKKQKLYAIYCMPDHIHMLVSMAPTCNISDLVRDIKANSSSFIQEKTHAPYFRWQTGFGAFSNSQSQIDKVAQYIINQPQHHAKKSFREEYLEFLEKNEVDFKEEYLFEFY